ncbi:hypothetical protein HAX54_033805, partial [Datura stramonium]|nr:hypothetical protein [Datura stramonium]
MGQVETGLGEQESTIERRPKADSLQIHRHVLEIHHHNSLIHSLTGVFTGKTEITKSLMNVCRICGFTGIIHLLYFLFIVGIFYFS